MGHQNHSAVDMDYQNLYMALQNLLVVLMDRQNHQIHMDLQRDRVVVMDPLKIPMDHLKIHTDRLKIPMDRHHLEGEDMETLTVGHPLLPVHHTDRLLLLMGLLTLQALLMAYPVLEALEVQADHLRSQSATSEELDSAAQDFRHPTVYQEILLQGPLEFR